MEGGGKKRGQSVGREIGADSDKDVSGGGVWDQNLRLALRDKGGRGEWA